MIEIYTDGACSGNPGPGGFGVVVFDGEKILHYHSEQSQNTTNNREEIKAISYAIKYCLREKISATIYTDSAYCYNALNTWIYSWARNNWTNSKKQEIKNKDVFEEIYNNYIENFSNCQIRIEKIKGHSGILGNEIADALATEDEVRLDLLLWE